MTINLIEIYKGLKAYRQERGLTAQNQKSGYIVNIMEELGELSTSLRDYEKIKNGEQVVKKYIANEWVENNAKYALIKYKKVTLADAEHFIVDALCDIAVLTINAGEDIDFDKKYTDLIVNNDIWLPFDFQDLLEDCGKFGKDFKSANFNNILMECSQLCEKYGFNFEVAMLETIKEISSRTGKYDESAKKWVKDESDEAKAKWYKADYEKARIKK